MYREIDDFITAWQYETDQTIKLFEHLTDESLNQKVTDDGRSLGFLAWHITQTLGEMLGLTGLKIDAPDFETTVPNNAAAIISAFSIAAKSVSNEVKTSWTNETLHLEDNMYGETWKRGLTLLYLMLHQAHHRGQITVLMRQAGLKVVGIYGPAKEEWAESGMPAMA